MFQIGATGCPEQVWRVLTNPGTTRRFLGISLQSEWAVGSRISGSLDGAPMMVGEVLFTECPARLSYMLAIDAGHPEIYVTWELRGCDSGTIVRLSLDEADSEDTEELEASWQPVVTALQALLSTPPDGAVTRLDEY